MKTLSDFLVVIAAIASMAMSALGFSVGVWGGFWNGAGLGALLDTSLWLVPTLSVFAFVIYIISKTAGLICTWGIAFGSVMTSICSLASGQSKRFILLFPLIQLIACLALQGDARIQKTIADRLAPGSDAS